MECAQFEMIWRWHHIYMLDNPSKVSALGHSRCLLSSFPYPTFTSVVMMKHSYIRSFHASYRSNLFQIVIERHILPWMSEQLAQSQRLSLHNFLKKA
jgi:hypothetical protein